MKKYFNVFLRYVSRATFVVDVVVDAAIVIFSVINRAFIQIFQRILLSYFSAVSFKFYDFKTKMTLLCKNKVLSHGKTKFFLIFKISKVTAGNLSYPLKLKDLNILQ